MRAGTERTADLPAATMAALMLAVFTVSIGFSVVLPLLPYVTERLLGAGAEGAQVSRHTGFLTAVYTLSLFLFAPMWGRAADHYGPRGVLLVGVGGFGVTTLMFSFVESLPLIYGERLLSGMFAAAVSPVAAAAIGTFVTTEGERARRLAFVSMAGISGFLVGPTLGALLTGVASDIFALTNPAGSLTIPLAATAVLAFFAACIVAIAVPHGGTRAPSPRAAEAATGTTSWLVPRLLVLSFIVSAGVGVFEVALALRGKQELGLTPYQIGLMFTECSLVMFVMQAIVFSPWFRPELTRWLIAPALSVMAAGLFMMPRTSDFTSMLVVIAAVAASAGVLSPILTYWISAKAGTAQGWELGKQTAAASLGISLGSAAGGLFFDGTAVQGASFVLAAALTMIGCLMSIRLPQLLAVSASTRLVADTSARNR